MISKKNIKLKNYLTLYIVIITPICNTKLRKNLKIIQKDGLE